MIRFLLSLFVIFAFSSTVSADVFALRCVPTGGVSITNANGLHDIEKLEVGSLSSIVIRLENDERRAAMVVEREGQPPIPYMFSLEARDTSNNVYQFNEMWADLGYGLIVDVSKAMATRYLIATFGKRHIIDYSCVSLDN